MRFLRPVERLTIRFENNSERNVGQEVLNEEVNDFSKDKSKYECTVEANREFEERSKREMNLFSTDND